MAGTRSEHLAWAKERALAYLPDDPRQALTSFHSDLGAHPETENHPDIIQGFKFVLAGLLSTPDAVRVWIEGVK